MNRDALLKRGGPLVVLAAVTALALVPSAASSAGAGSSAGTIPGCTPAKNVEAIIDDSGSMSSSDPSKFRTSLLSAFANIQANNGLILGGGEFGSEYNVLFGPAAIPAINTAMEASFIQVDSDNGGTDYQLAFTGANGHNGTADARIFLTDGLATKPTAHLTPKIKTYVIALGEDFATDPDAQPLLQSIAAETGGPAPFLISDPSQIQPVAGAITAAINCKNPPLTFTKTFTQQGQQVTYQFKPAGSTADILISWGNPTTLLDPNGFSLGGGATGKGRAAYITYAKKGGKKGKAKLKVTEKKGTTFATVKLKGLKKGKKVKFKVKAAKLTTATVGTTQIIK